jgi:predicted neutral ceramidase superfamily lipid hydrolase
MYKITIKTKTKNIDKGLKEEIEKGLRHIHAKADDYGSDELWYQGSEIKSFIESLFQSRLGELRSEVKKIISGAVKETEKVHGSPNVYIDMVGEIAIENLDTLIPKEGGG